MKRIERIPLETIKVLKTLFPDSEAVFNKAIEVMIMKTDRCLCDVPVNSYYIRIPGVYQLKCRRCKRVVSPLSITPMSRAHKDLTDILDLVCRFYHTKSACSPTDIAQLYRCKYETAQRKTKRVTEWMKLALSQSGPSLKGKNNNDTKIIRAFSAEHENLNSAMNALFHALPPLTMAFKK